MVLCARVARSAALLLIASGTSNSCFSLAEKVDKATNSTPTGSGVTGKLGDAESITNNPPARYLARWLPTDSNPFTGAVEAISSPDGRGVIFLVNFENLPLEGGPFTYHVHDQPVPDDGNCNKTLAHLDPYQRGQKPGCDSTKPQTCEVGDLSGKHGKVEGTRVQDRMFHDMYTSLAEGIGAYVGNRSVVIHFANSSRFACSNFIPVYADLQRTQTRPFNRGSKTTHARRILSFIRALRRT